MSRTGEEELGEQAFLEAYGKKEYPKPSMTADIAVFRAVSDALEVLLIRRGNHPYKGFWAFPGGFANPDEDVVDAARRELAEETGVTDIPLELFGIYGAPGRDPRGWTVSGGFCALIEDGVDAQAGDDAADARWCAIRETPRSKDSTPTADSAGDGDAVVLSVECAPDETLFVRFCPVPQKFGAPRALVLDASGFAFDHAQLLADAYLKVTHLQH